MNVEALVPLHFVAELHAGASALGVDLVGYDQEGRPERHCEPSALFRWWLSTEAGDRILRENPGIRWMHTGSAGVDHILTPAFRETGITLTNSAGVHAPSIAEWVVTMILAEEKRLETIFRQQAERIWKVAMSGEIAGRRAVIVGGGHIAREIASRLRAMRIVVTAVTRSGAGDASFDLVVPVSALETVCGDADWLIVALPLTAETRGLVSARLLAQLPPRARVINVARGGIVDEAALIDALAGGRLAGAILDVFETEPLPADHPLWGTPGVRILPHTTWRSEQVHARQMSLFLENLARFTRDEPLRNVVDPARGY